MSSFCERKLSEEDLLGCWEIVSCKLSDECYSAVEGVQFHLEEGGDLIWIVPPALEQESLPFFSCETFVFDSFSGELVCYGNNVDKIALKVSKLITREYEDMIDHCSYMHNLSSCEM
ncbi:uncharacterized protein LOC110058203 [Orbicella faveolata]|uniref:uncharacterized protein LOC110058203 n=1 Tax=Orbicella faveolata TaxID=48498 RepID=UPI0009E3B8A0|nr:uncharacterized protein LOC110058203 [Orbicella faveolata]